MLHYHIAPKNLGAHLIHVAIHIPAGESTIVAKMPKWIPGSYKIRDYSRHLHAFSATANGCPLSWQKADSDTWIIASQGQATILEYDIYAYDLSVRGAYLDDTRFFFNHCCVCLDIVHLSTQKRTIDIETIDNWSIFTALNQEGVFYIAEDYAQQIDCPVESAERYLHHTFTAGGVEHEMIFTGSLSDEIDTQAMAQHLKRICEAEIQLFAGTPLDKYLFMTYIEANQYGGLEHKNSVAQMATPEMMMKKGQPIDEKMVDFMGLCSHEYFHLWNIKRLQPKDFQPYDLYQEQNTEMLWIFEGFTSYYDELFLLRAGVVDANTFVQRQAKNLNRVLNTPGRTMQSLSESSFDAWTKLYQADASSPNYIISYYSKGAVFALYLDLFLRKYSDNQHSLDDVMRYLWTHFGEKGIGIDEQDVQAACQWQLPAEQHQLLARVFRQGIHGTEDIPLADILPDFGIDVRHSVAQSQQQAHTSDSGLRLNINGDKAKITFVDSGSHASQIGISIDDELWAINGQNASIIDFNQQLNFNKAKESLRLTLSRRGRLFEKNITLNQAPENQIHLSIGKASALGQLWLAQWTSAEK